MKSLFTSESVSVGHPDFVASAISDAILDYCVSHDENSRCGIEVLCVPNTVILGGEVTTLAPLSLTKVGEIVRDTVRSIGYTDSSLGFSADELVVENYLHQQSPDINQGVDRDSYTGFGDQGIMFGYACDDTEDLYPLAAYIANKLMLRYNELQLNHPEILSPDGKSQVTIDTSNNTIDTIIIAASHKEDIDPEKLESFIKTRLINPVLEDIKVGDETAFDLLTDETKILINTTGKFVLCGPYADAGVNGRKLVVDSYGGYARIGGGNMHGKDASKSDFSLAVYARYLAKNLVAAGIAKKVEIQLASAIGEAEPVSIKVDTFGTGIASDEHIAEVLKENFDMSCDNIIRSLHLLRANRKATNFCFTFGCSATEDGDSKLRYLHPWEATDLVDKLKKLF